MLKIFRGVIIPILILTCIFSILFYVRMMPSLNNRVEFTLDCSFNYRMTSDVIKDGKTPSIDRLSTYPEGKNIKTLLPTGMYHACAFFHGALNRFKETPLSVSILLFSSFFGSIIILPVYLISQELYRNKITSCVTAFLAGIIPAYLNRTTCYWFRYEVLAMPVLFISLLFFIKAFGADQVKKTFAYAIASVAFLIIGFYIWRLTIIFVPAYIICALYLPARDNKALKKTLAVFLALFCLYLALLLFIPGFGLRNPGSNYGGFPKAIIQIALNNMGIRQHFSEFTRLVLDNQELARTSIPEMFSWQMLSFSGAFILLYFYFYLASRSRKPQKDIIFIFLIFFFVLTFFVTRNKAILGVLTAIAAGESINFLFNKNRKVVTVCAAAILIIIIAKTGFDGYKLASTRYGNTKLGPYLTQTLVTINKSTPADAVIHCYWADGYPIQTYCNRPTLTDGLFESPEIVKRILAESEAWYSYNEDDLWNFCKSYGATHLLLPMRRKLSYAHQAGLDYGMYFTKSGPTTLGKLTTLFKLMYTPQESARFRQVFRNKDYALFVVQ